MKKLFTLALFAALPILVFAAAPPKAAGKLIPEDLVMAVLASAQAPLPGSVSSMSYMSSMTGAVSTTSTLVVGRVIDEFPTNLIPAGFRVLGGSADASRLAAYAVSEGMSPEGALRALTIDAAHMYAIDSRVGALVPGLDADMILLDGSPLDVASSVTRVWVNGMEGR